MRLTGPHVVGGKRAKTAAVDNSGALWGHDHRHGRSRATQSCQDAPGGRSQFKLACGRPPSLSRAQRLALPVPEGPTLSPGRCPPSDDPQRRLTTTTPERPPSLCANGIEDSLAGDCTAVRRARSRPTQARRHPGDRRSVGSSCFSGRVGGVPIDAGTTGRCARDMERRTLDTSRAKSAPLQEGLTVMVSLVAVENRPGTITWQRRGTIRRGRGLRGFVSPVVCQRSRLVGSSRRGPGGLHAGPSATCRACPQRRHVVGAVDVRHRRGVVLTRDGCFAADRDCWGGLADLRHGRPGDV